MLATLFTFSFLIACFSSIFFIFKRNKKKIIFSLGVGFISLLLVGVFAPEAAQLTVDKTNIETDKNGLATITGQTNKKAVLTLNDKTLPLDKDGYFTYDLQLTDGQEQAIDLTTHFNDNEIIKQVTVSAPGSFKKKLADLAKKEEENRLAKQAEEKKQLELKEVETAVHLAETNPSEKNYEAAYSLLTVMDNQPTDLISRLDKVQTQLTLEKELMNKKEEAEAAILSAEQTPTETNYETAKMAIFAIPQEQQGNLSTRLNNVKESLEAQQVSAQTVAKETQIENPVANEASQTVLVTPTGKKYHSYVCGNGNYSEASLESAEARGLTPCSKCF